MCSLSEKQIGNAYLYFFLLLQIFCYRCSYPHIDLVVPVCRNKKIIISIMFDYVIAFFSLSVFLLLEFDQFRD